MPEIFHERMSEATKTAASTYKKIQRASKRNASLQEIDARTFVEKQTSVQLVLYTFYENFEQKTPPSRKKNKSAGAEKKVLFG